MALSCKDGDWQGNEKHLGWTTSEISEEPEKVIWFLLPACILSMIPFTGFPESFFPPSFSVFYIYYLLKYRPIAPALYKLGGTPAGNYGGA